MQRIVFFDGECGLCSRTVRLLARLDRRGVLRFAPLQGETARRLGLEVPAADEGTMLVFREGMEGPPLGRSEAAFELVRALGWPWRVLGVLRLVPRRLRDAGYDFVARRRRWFGSADSCRLDSGAVASRLLS